MTLHEKHGGTEKVPATPKADLTDVDVIFEPNKGPQEDFLRSPQQEVLYGGSAGGGKSYAMLMDPLRYVDNPASSALLLRKTTDELRELIQKSQELYPKAFPGAKWSTQKSTWTFPRGGKLWMSYLDKDEDVLRYQGQAYTWVGFDELTHWHSPVAWDALRARLRSPGETGIQLRMRATTNPGGPGHMWVKKTFIDPAPFNRPFWATDLESGETLRYPDDYSDPDKAGRPLFKRRFIPARLRDNPHLFADGQYEANLMSLPEQKRKQLLDGDWDVAEGAAFGEFNRNIHVVDETELPANWKTWPRFRTCDYGYSSWTGVLWIAVAPDGQLLVYRELYVKKHDGRMLGQAILDIEYEAKERIPYGMLDDSVWFKRGNEGPSVAERMQSMGLRWRPAPRHKGSRVAGKNELHRLLRVDEFTGNPGIVFLNTCTNLIAQLPTLPLDKTNPEDINTKIDYDHLYDALRYGIMSRPQAFQQAMQFNSQTRAQKYRPASSTFGY